MVAQKVSADAMMKGLMTFGWTVTTGLIVWVAASTSELQVTMGRIEERMIAGERRDLMMEHRIEKLEDDR